METPWPGQRAGFSAALKKGRDIAVIAEYKRASPSKGEINLGLGPEEVAAAYAASGAAALSVLTEEDYFKGELSFLERMSSPGLPLLRKDFIFDSLQVEQTASTPASAVLLIARMFENARGLQALCDKCAACGLEAVVEVFDRKDLDMAKTVGAGIIQVNNRDLDTLKTDLAVSAGLVRAKEEGEVWISASGITRSEELSRMKDLGFDAALIGTWLMAGGDPGARLEALIKGEAA